MIIGAVAVIVIILLLLVFWAHVARERRENITRKKVRTPLKSRYILTLTLTNEISFALSVLFNSVISDYLSERRNDPERRENRLSVVIIGAVAVIVIILLTEYSPDIPV